MKGFVRKDRLFSLCGLNCGLCPMQLDGYCPGCGGGEGNQSCKIARCSMEHDCVQYCFACSEYPCGKLNLDTPYDSFITHRNQRKDLARAKEIGVEAYCAEQREKVEWLQALLKDYNDGRRKTFFCTAVNLLPLPAVRRIMERLEAEKTAELERKERSARAVQLFLEAAQQEQIEIRLRRKSKTR